MEKDAAAAELERIRARMALEEEKEKQRVYKLKMGKELYKQQLDEQSMKNMEFRQKHAGGLSENERRLNANLYVGVLIVVDDVR